MKTNQLAQINADVLRKYDNPAPAQAQHSPLPWHRSGRIIQNHDTPIVELIGHKWGANDLDYIVRACNNAQRLADALKGMMGAFCRNVEQTVANEGENALQSDVKRAREALAQWEGSKQ